MRVLPLLLLLTLLGGAETVHTVAPGIGIATPADWTIERTPGGGIALRAPAVAGEAALERPAIAVMGVDPASAGDAKAIIDASLAQLARLLPGFALVEPATAVELHGRPWQHARYRFTVGETEFEQIVLAGVGPSGGLTVTCSTTRGAFARHLPVFASALASLGRAPSRLAP